MFGMSFKTRYIYFLSIRVISSVGLEHLPYKQGVIGSSPISPTKIKPIHYISMDWLYWYK